MTSDAVSHPAHYGGADNPYEVIKVLEAWLTREQMVGFLKGNIFKYMARAEKKAKREDIQKAGWYMRYLDEFEERVPASPKIDADIAKQLQRSMELNAKIKNGLRAILSVPGISGLDLTTQVKAMLELS